MTRDQAIAIAREAARQQRETHSYLSGVDTDPTWAPHGWVIEAMLAAVEAEKQALKHFIVAVRRHKRAP